MSVGTRVDPEKALNRMWRPKDEARRSRKWEKQKQNRKDRHLANLDPEAPPRAKYLGWYWQLTQPKQ